MTDSQNANDSQNDTQSHAVPAQLLHDLRTPLNHIIGYSEILREQAVQENREDAAADTARIYKAGKLLLSLIETHFQAVTQSQSTPARESAFADDVDDAIADVTQSIGDEISQSRILIVDDNESNRDVLARRLSKENFEVEMVGSGREALARLQERSFDTVLLDIMMPEMDGYEVLRRMKADKALHRIPVIMISALNEMDSVVRCIEMGAEDYLPKPFSATLLRARIGACLEKKRAHDREMRLLAQVQKNYSRLRRTEQQRDDLMHMIVHDLRTPLASNLAGIEMVEMIGTLTDEQKHCLEIAMRSGNNLLGLINDLLDIAKMESGALKLDLQPCDAPYIAAVAADQIAPLMVDKQLHMTRDFAPDLPALNADESKLRRVFINLLSNAVKFTPREGQITFTAHARDGEVLFSIQDTGEGIPEASLTNIFEKYRQVEDRKSGRQNSTGLGLTYCKLAVDAHGGRIWVESTPGVGSTFFFTIPTI